MALFPGQNRAFSLISPHSSHLILCVRPVQSQKLWKMGVFFFLLIFKMEALTGAEKHSDDLSHAVCAQRASGEAAAEQWWPWSGREPPVAPDLVRVVQLSSASTATRQCSFVLQPSASIHALSLQFCLTLELRVWVLCLVDR